MSLFMALQLFVPLFGQHIELPGEWGTVGRMVKLDHFTIEEGLPTNVVNCGIEDREGFIWLGTREGLVRYDGQSFKTFTTKEGLLSNSITRIAQVEDDWLWILCGLNSFDNNLGGEFMLFNTTTYQCLTLTEKFPNVEVPYFRHLCHYQDTALILYSKESRFYTYSPHVGLQALDLVYDTDNNFLVSANGLIWVSKISGKGRGDFKVFCFDFEGHILEEIEVVNIAREPFFIVGFNENHRPIGTVHFDADSRQVLAQLEVDGALVSVTNGITDNTQVEKLYQFCGATIELKTGQHLFFRPKGEGVYLRQPKGTLEQILTEEESADIPIGNLRASLFTSHAEIIWWCTPEGLFKLSLKKDRFRKYLNNSHLGKVESIRGILVDEDGAMYASSDQQGVVGLNEHGVGHSFSHEQAFFILKNDDKLYYNWEGIVFQYDLKTKETLWQKVGDVGDLWSACVDSKGNWWFGGGRGVKWAPTWNGDQIDLTKKLFAGIDGQVFTLQIFEADEKIWFVTTKGLFAYEPDSGESERVGAEWMTDVHHVCQGTHYWWISTNGNGLIRWNRRQNKFRQFTSQEGLSSNTLYACLEDDLGHIWVSGNYGLMRIDTTHYEVITYTDEDGLPHNEFNRVSWYKDSKGQLYFGGLNGFVKVKPGDFSEVRKPYSAPLQVSSFFQYDEAQQKLADFTTQIRRTNRIVVTPNTGFFALKVNLLDYKDDKKQYSYQIEDLQTEWTWLEENVLQMGDLPFGTHQLRLRGRNQRGEWSSHELAFELLVLRPFYLTWWFVVIIIVVLVGSVVGVVRWRTWRLKQDRERLQQTVDEQTEELRRSVVQKDVLLREIHHRVKNNLQVISSLLNLERTAGHDAKTLGLIMEARHRIKSMALIHKNLYQHDDLANILMNEYFKELFSGLHASYAIKKKKVEYAINCQVDALEVDMAIPLGIMTTEVVTNSFKYAFGEKDEGLVELSFTEDENVYQLVISDNGPGLPDEYLELQSKSLGLRLIKLLIGQLKGQVTVKNKRGTAFIFEFPKQQDFSPKEQ